MRKKAFLIIGIMVISMNARAQRNGGSKEVSGHTAPGKTQTLTTVEPPHRFGLGLDYTFPLDPKITVRFGFCGHWFVEHRLGYEFTSSGNDIEREHRAIYSDLEFYYSYWHRERIELFTGVGTNWEHLFVSDGYEKSDAYLNVTLLGIEWRPVEDIPYLALGADGIYKQGPGDRPGTYFRINVLCYVR